jgi:lysophospholipase L1-like esterase
MKLFFPSLFLAVCLIAQPVPRQFRKGDVWVAVGDSITHSRRYHSFIYLYYLTRFPDQPFQLVNCGVSGDSAGGAVQRFSWDIAPHHPTVATIMLGMNDVGRGSYGKDKTDPATLQRRQAAIDGHMQNMDRLSAMLRETGCDLIYLTPSIYDQTAEIATENLFGVNDALGTCGQRVAAELAPKYSAGVADLHGPMTALNEAYQAEDKTRTLVGSDRVHPGDLGQFLMAYLFLKAQQVPSLVADMAVDMQGQVLTSTNCTLSELETGVGRVSFTYLAKALPYPVPVVASEALELVPFLDEMNREMLTVKGLAEGTYVLVIDDEPVLVASAGELAAGVNLATCDRTPMYRQAQAVAELNDRRHTIPAHRLRTLAAQKHFMGRDKNLDTENYEAMKAALEARVEQLRESNNPLYGYMKGQAATYIKYKPLEQELWTELAGIVEELWKINQPTPHRLVIRPGTAADIAQAEGRILDEFSSFDAWRPTGWTNSEASVSAADGVVTIVATRTEGERDMLGYSRNLEADLTGVKAINVRFKADKGAPFGVEWAIDGKLVRLHNYVPASGDWETVSLPVAGKRAGNFTLILAEGGANAQWATKTATYQFDRIWLE